MKSDSGLYQGIGISIIPALTVIDGVERVAIKVINVTKDSPAEKAGLKVNDLVIYLGIGENKKSMAFNLIFVSYDHYQTFYEITDAKG